MCLKSLYGIADTWRYFLWSLGEKNAEFPLDIPFFYLHSYYLYFKNIVSQIKYPVIELIPNS
jgi:hypothetical protein